MEVPTRRVHQPFIDLSDADAEKLRKAGFSTKTVKEWREKKRGPYRKVIQKINRALGRVVRDPGAVVENLEDAQRPVVVPVAIAVYETTLNACADDDLCLAARKATMRYVANTLKDQRRQIACASCKRGIARAKAAAAKKVAHVGALTCSCGEEKSRYAAACQECASERKRAMP